MVIKILGSGCKNCQRLHQNVVDAVAQLGIEADVFKVTDIREIARYQAMRMPALVIDEVVVISGRVPESPELVDVIKKSGKN